MAEWYLWFCNACDWTWRGMAWNGLQCPRCGSKDTMRDTEDIDAPRPAFIPTSEYVKYMSRAKARLDAPLLPYPDGQKSRPGTGPMDSGSSDRLG